MITVEVKENDNRDRVITHAGTYWRRGNGDTYILSYIDNGNCGLIGIEDGGLWSVGVEVGSRSSITSEEWDRIQSSEDFTQIKSGTITINISEDKD